MKETFEDLPGWTFEIREVSANAFKATGSDGAGHSFEFVGYNEEAVVEEAKGRARTILESGRTLS
jgi:hypothetical protein